MNKQMISVEIHHADRTRRARVSLPIDMTVAQMIKVVRKRWSLPFSVDFQMANSRTGMMLLGQDTLRDCHIQSGDILVLQPFAVHG